MIRSLLTVKFQDLRVVQIAFQMVVDIHSSPAFNWTSGVNQIARLEGEKPTHIANQFVGRVNHICSRTALNRPAIYVELEINIFQICQRFLVDPEQPTRRIPYKAPTADLRHGTFRVTHVQ